MAPIPKAQTLLAARLCEERRIALNLKIDKAGRIILPKTVRDRLQNLAQSGNLFEFNFSAAPTLGIKITRHNKNPAKHITGTPSPRRA